ncbi:MAG: carbohydrate binding family 9 domain-containing protein [Thermoanaerobaculia bacterium]|nr:carbohydrate binding family 9 domain-containing protein [Thermoanaerobaculia bacterium]
MTQRRAAAWIFVLCAGPAAGAATETPVLERTTLRVEGAAGPITVDGDLSEPAWQQAREVETWHQIRPATDAPPKVRSRAWLAFDDRHLYVAFELDDPDPRAIRAPLTDRDNALISSDYAGIIIDGVDDGKTAQEFLANPRGVQYDAIWSDIAGESLAPNFHYESAARIHERGWTLEMKIPFASVRYVPGPEPVWGVTLIRNWPRERRYEFSSAPQPTSCFICNENRLVGLESLPAGGSWVVAPYVTARRAETPEGGVLGAPLESKDVDYDGGFDLKWNPTARHTVDLTFQPDFSQVETDVPQIATNQRFALFFPERRPFFLEQVDLFSTPFSAVYTRSVTDPRAGARATGRFGKNAYTLLLTEDLGGGSVILPGATESRIVEQAFESNVLLGRLRHDFGPDAYASFVVTDREIDGGGYNRVFGPDFQWKRGDTDVVSGQLLWSRSETPVLPEIADEWDGRQLSGRAALVSWDHGAGAWDWNLSASDVDGEFRADNGFMPRVGYRQASGSMGRSWGLGGGFLSGARLFTYDEYSIDEDDDILTRVVSGGLDLRGQRNFALRVQARSEDLQVAGRLLSQTQGRMRLRVTPGGAVANLVTTAYAGSAVDFDNAREGDGWGASIEAILRSTKHVELRLDAARDVLDVDDPLLGSGRLFTADVLRARAVYTFTPAFFVRAIVQLSRVERDPTLYTFAVDEEDEGVDASLLLAYKLDWQSVVYLGYGDSRVLLADTGRREKAGREVFFKLSYAFRRR